jgi:hypothetical protein
MKFLFIAALIATAIIVAAWLLPWWATLLLVFLIIAPVVYFVWKILRTLKKEVVPALKKFSEGMPRAQERLASVPAGERFRGNGFAFTFPVPCDVSQTVIDDLEALLLKPKLNGDGATPNGLIIVSTIPRDELKNKINSQLEAVFSQVQTALAQQPREGQALRAEEFLPAEVGPFRGEFRRLEIVKDGKAVRGETVYLGGEKFSVAWALIGPAETFDPAAARFRELAGLIERMAEPAVIDVPRLTSGSDESPAKA